MAANVINQLSTANTFQHWLNATQSLIATANLLTNGNGSTFYANTRLEIGGSDSSTLNVVTSATINVLYANTITSNTITANNITANIPAANVVGVIKLSQGGTNAASYTTGTLLVSNGTAIVSLANTGTAGSYGSASQVAAITTDAYGRVSSVTNTSISIPTTAVTGVFGYSSGGTNAASYTTGTLLVSNGTAIVSLANTGTAGTYANSTHVPVITTDAYGRVTGITNTAIAITINNGTGISGGGTDTSFTLSIGQEVATTSNVQFRTIGVGTTADSANAGSIRATGDITASYSDERLKEDIIVIDSALSKINNIRGVYYTPNDIAVSYGYRKDRKVGVIAQDIEKVLPEIVVSAPFDSDENGNSISGKNYKTVQYEKLVPLLIEAIKELSSEVEKLKKKQ